MRKLILTGIILISGLCAESMDTFYNDIVKEVSEQNEILPNRLDEMTVLEKVTSDNVPLEIKHTYVLNDFTVETKGNKDYIINYKNIMYKKEMWKKQYKNKLIKKSCFGQHNRFLLERGITFKSEYKWETGEKLFKFSIRKQDCIEKWDKK